MSRYKLPSAPPPAAKARRVDPDGGFLCVTMCWRPDPQAANPDRPGVKLSMSIYLPARPEDDCLCGSGKPYGKCCRLKPAWHPICADPGMSGYSLLAPQSATYANVDGDAVRKRLVADHRLHCVDDGLESSFWLHWGEPAVESEYGMLCFGDLELKQNRTLLVTALSDRRMRVLRDLLQELFGDSLGAPQLARDPIPTIDKKRRRR